MYFVYVYYNTFKNFVKLIIQKLDFVLINKKSQSLLFLIPFIIATKNAATKPAEKPLLYKLSPPWLLPIIDTTHRCTMPAITPMKGPNFPAIGANVVPNNAASMVPGELTSYIEIKEPSHTPTITGIILRGCFPKAANPIIVNKPLIVGPL